ncbi:MAG: protein-export chaperone SecB [Legionellales bacterium]|nr:protein-export chaperone SecB [Legionellales bacterium]
MSTEANQPENDLQQFIIQRLYIKNSSFETTQTPAIFQKKWEPELNLELNTNHTELEANTYEVTLTVTATVKNKEETAFLVEVQQAGVFTVNGPDAEQLNHILGGSFPPLVLSPINFDALYMQKMQAQQEQKVDVQ